jgi:hypothetical protein
MTTLPEDDFTSFAVIEETPRSFLDALRIAHDISPNMRMSRVEDRYNEWLNKPHYYGIIPFVDLLDIPKAIEKFNERLPDEPYDDYLFNLKQDPIARKVEIDTLELKLEIGKSRNTLDAKDEDTYRAALAYLYS